MLQGSNLLAQLSVFRRQGLDVLFPTARGDLSFFLVFFFR
jgi:hypothetical protein